MNNNAPLRLDLISRYSPALLDSNQACSFINFASIGSLMQRPPGAVAYFCDGMLMSSFMSRVTRRRIERVSFDFTSIADPVFRDAQQQGRSLYVVGATQAQLDGFVAKLRLNYPGLIIAGQHHGYVEPGQAAELHADIRNSAANILLVGLGAGLQERFVLAAQAAGFGGVAFTCGGFIRQESGSPQRYYPALINRLHLRAFYRMYREPHTIRRYLLDYPRNFLTLAGLLLRGKLQINFTAH